LSQYFRQQGQRFESLEELVKEFYKQHSGTPRRIHVGDFDVFHKFCTSRCSTLEEEEGITNNK